jgi:thiol-disulfide isomerase/thioredoxin
MTEITAPEKKTTAFYIKRTIGIILLLALAAVFSYSAYTKIGAGEGVDPFTWTFIDMGINSQLWAGVLARVMVGLEFLIAALLLLHIFLKSFTYPATITVLSIFTIYLIIQIALHGNTGNCGCFGEELKMTPLNGIWKNLAMIAATAALIYLYPVKPYRGQMWIGPVVGMIAIVMPFILDPINASLIPTAVKRSIDLSPLYEKEKKPEVELREGKHIVAFMSLTCPHCRKAAKRFAIIHDNNPEIPVFFVLAGNPKNLKPFFEETESEKVPHVLFRDPDNFLKMAGSGVPAIYFINNSVVEREANYFQLDPQYMKQWLGK